jgi:hypothetical protein
MTREELHDKMFKAVISNTYCYPYRSEYDRSKMKDVIDELYDKFEKRSCDGCTYLNITTKDCEFNDCVRYSNLIGYQDIYTTKENK